MRRARKLDHGQVWTSHDGTNLYRRVLLPGGDHIGYVENRRQGLQYCQRSTFLAWIRKRKARKTQKYRRRAL